MADGFPAKSGTDGTGFFLVDPRFTDLRPLSYGGNGVVYSSIDSECDKAVAIKKLNFTDKKTCKYALREIRLMRRLQHENIVTVYEILGPNGFVIDRNNCRNLNELRCLYVVQELLDTDLYQLIQNQCFTEEHAKLFLYQLLRGLKYIHSANVVHRDLKPANLLINLEDFVLKITDFGLARVVDNEYSHKGFLTDGVGTCWYRSPELILSPRDYTKAIDMWSVGCIFAEMITGKPLFPGGNEMDQIGHVLDALHFSDNEWNTLTLILPLSVLRNRSKTPKLPLLQRFKDCDPQAMDLLVRLLCFNPEKRITADEAICHPYLNKYSCPQDEPTVLRAFHIEHEVDELSPKTLRRMIGEEIDTSNSIQACGSQILGSSDHKDSSPSNAVAHTENVQSARASIDREMEREMEKIKDALEDIEILCAENKLVCEMTDNNDEFVSHKNLDLEIVVNLPDEENKKEQLSPKEDRITEKEKNSVEEKEDILVELTDLSNDKDNTNLKNQGHCHVQHKVTSVKDKDRLNEVKRAESPRESVELKNKNKIKHEGNPNLPKIKHRGKDRTKKEKWENVKNEKKKKNENSKNVSGTDRDFDSMYRLPTEHLTRRRNSRNERLLGSRKLHEEVNARLKFAEREKEKSFGAVGGNMSLWVDYRDESAGSVKEEQGQRSRSSSGSSEASREDSTTNDELHQRRFEH